MLVMAPATMASKRTSVLGSVEIRLRSSETPRTRLVAGASAIVGSCSAKRPGLVTVEHSNDTSLHERRLRSRASPVRCALKAEALARRNSLPGHSHPTPAGESPEGPVVGQNGRSLLVGCRQNPVDLPVLGQRR